MKPEDKKIKEENKRMFYISIVMIVFLLTISYYHFKNTPSLKKITTPSFPEQYTPFNAQEMLSMPQEKINELIKENDYLFGVDKEKDYVRKKIEGVVSFDIPSFWEIIPVSTEENHQQVKVVFIAESQQLGYPMNFTVVRIEENDIEMVIEIIKENAGGETAEISIEEKDDVYLLEIRNTISEKASSLSKTKIVFIDNHCYLFMITFFEGSSPDQSLIAYVLSSVQIIE
jgi:hypothetical protein